MRELKSLTPLADLDTQRIRSPRGFGHEGFFDAAKFYAVTFALWTGLLALLGVWWVGAVSVARWMGA